MSLPDHLDWPFLEPRHRDIAATFTAWVEREVAPRAAGGEADVDAACRDLVARLGVGGWLEHCASDEGTLDVRTLCLLRETLAYRRLARGHVPERAGSDESGD